MLLPFTGGNARVVLGTAIHLAGYDSVFYQVMAFVDSSDDYSGETKRAIGQMGERIGRLFTDPSLILQAVATMKWSEIGLAEDALPALTTADRAGIIDIIMGVSKSIIQDEADRLSALASADTTLPEGWND